MTRSAPLSTDAATVIDDAGASAARANRPVWGSGDILVAFFASPNPAGTALKTLGLSAEAVEHALEMLRPPATDTVEPRPSHEVDHVLKIASAIAQTLNDGELDTRHLLAGILWEQDSVATRILAGHGIPYERCFREVFHHAPPAALVPPPVESAEYGDPFRVPASALAPLLAYLADALPKEYKRGFNIDGEEAIIWVDHRADLQALMTGYKGERYSSE